ncbi:hypothetical protein HGM15179_018124, partial [Zosterops borbonicus]
MSRAGILASLLRVEENFCSKLSRIHFLVLEPLLGTEPDDPKSREVFPVLRQLRDQLQALWDFSEENSRELRGKLGSGCPREFPALARGEQILKLHIQYFVTLGNFIVIQGFEWAAKSRSALCEAVQGLPGAVGGSPPGRALLWLLQEPFREHVRKQLRLLRRLRDTLNQEPEHSVVAAVERELGKLDSFISQALEEAAATRDLWASLGHKFTAVLRVPERRLLQDSRAVPIAALGVSRRSQRLLLFDDVLVLIQGNSFQSFDLKLVWVDENSEEKSTPGSYNLNITTPEESFVLSAKEPQMKSLWRWKLEQAVRQALNGRRDFPLWGHSGEGGPFRGEGRLRGATYEGEWLRGKPHGKGTLKWRDGRNHVGEFRDGLEHGFGISLSPRRSRDRFDCSKCHWSRGRICGYGIWESGDDQVYRGYFKDDLRHGFGVLESSGAERPFRYTGHWERGRKHGYGIWEDTDRGERYLGMWRDDLRHGAGVVVTQSGLCYQRTFHMGKMVGSGILILEDDSVYEGNFTEDLTFAGKGKLSLANGSGLEGTQSTRNGHEIQLGVQDLPAQDRWVGILQPFQEFLRRGCPRDRLEEFLGFHCGDGKRGKFGIPQSQDHFGIFQALESPLHPLGKLLRALGSAFQASYGGVGANRHLLGMAQAEVKVCARKIWEFSRALLGLSQEQRGVAEGWRLVLPLVLPWFYPELSLLYLLRHQRGDGLYCRGLVRLSRLPDLQLLRLLH